MGATDNRVRAGGFTMVELVVVLAIIGLMAAIAIPSFTRMGLFSGNELQDSARQLYTLLRAAKVYAGTYNIDTALVYSPFRNVDTGSSSLRAVAIMYRNRDTGVFVPVPREDQGQFSELPRDTRVLADAGSPPPGSESIWILRDNEEDVEKDLYAHVFDPSGRLRNPDGMKERYTFQVCYTPDASADEQFLNGTDASGGLRSIDINLYRATGRVEISND